MENLPEQHEEVIVASYGIIEHKGYGGERGRQGRFDSDPDGMSELACETGSGVCRSYWTKLTLRVY